MTLRTRLMDTETDCFHCGAKHGENCRHELHCLWADERRARIANRECWMSDLRTRLAETLRERQSAGVMGVVDLADAVLAVFGSPSDADVERVARELINEGAVYTWKADGLARAAIRALVAGEPS